MGSVTQTPAAPETQTVVDEPRQLVSFFVDGEEFGIEILRVQEIIRLQELTRVPNSPDFMAGVINLRGRVIPVISLRKRFGLAERASDKQARIVVTELHGNVLGFIVDSVSEVLRLESKAVTPPPRLNKVEREFVSGVGNVNNRLLILLNLEQLMSRTEEASVQAAVN
jgi:purine-binding chemotaxis protein CheW